MIYRFVYITSLCRKFRVKILVDLRKTMLMANGRINDYKWTLRSICHLKMASCFYNAVQQMSHFRHNENTPMQYTEIFKSCKKMKIFSKQFLIFFLFLLQNIDCGYTLEPPRRGGSNEYPQSMFMFWSKNKENRYTPPYPIFTV